MSEPDRFDLIVIGAGPAGAEAAITAAEQGLSVALIDEQPVAGGQVWRAPVGGFPGKGDIEQASGDRLRERLTGSRVSVFFGHRVWSAVRLASIEPDRSAADALRQERFRVDAVGPTGSRAFTAADLVVATGAHERVVPFPGWTLPGVVGLAAATVLLKSHGVAPGRRVVIAGCGPLLLAVAAGLARSGVELPALADLAHRGAWLRKLPVLLGQPALAARGGWWVTRTLRAGARLLSGHGVRRAEGRDRVERVVLGPVDADGAPALGPEQAFEVDALVVGHGLTTACEITRMLRAEHRFDRLRGGWVPRVDASFQTSIPGLYAVGDGAGVRGQKIASLAGRKAGLVVAASFRGAAGVDSSASAAALDPIDRQLALARPFSDAMAALMAQRPAQVAAIGAATVVCRCEDVTRSEIDAALSQCAGSLDQLKHFTRCGMGPCQGRYCGDTVQELAAIRLGCSRDQVAPWTGRPPLRPVRLAELIGDFSYDDIPIPRPAPL